MRDGRVYATRAGNTNASYMYALDATDGSVIWRSDSLVDESTTEGISFADNGDLIVGNFTSIMRINASEGTTMWKTTRYSPTSGGSQAVVSGYSVYTWEASGYGPKISVFDLNTGGYLYSSYGIGGGIVQQVAPFVGPNRLVYATRTQNNPMTDSLVAFVDIDTALERIWSVPLGYVPFASFGVGPDGSVYSYSANGEVIRIDSTGAVVGTSQQIILDYPAFPRMAIGADGILYVTNGGFADGALYSFNTDLTLRWSTPIVNVNVGGPAIGEGGVLVVCGVGTDVRAYEGGTGVTEHSIGRCWQGYLEVSPNPFTQYTTINCSIGQSAERIEIDIYDATGRLVRDLHSAVPHAPCTMQVRWDGHDDHGRSLPYGVYFVTLCTGNHSVTQKLLFIK